MQDVVTGGYCNESLTKILNVLMIIINYKYNFSSYDKKSFCLSSNKLYIKYFLASTTLKTEKSFWEINNNKYVHNFEFGDN